VVLSSVLLSAAFIGFCNPQPKRQPSDVSPPRSLFEPAVLISTIGQAFIHLFVLWQGVRLAKEAMGPRLLQDLLDFEEITRARTVSITDLDSLRKPFMPNLLNSVVFCLQLVIDVATILVNYKGGPWMRGIGEDPLLLLSVPAAIAVVAMCFQGSSFLELVPLPAALRRSVVLLSALAFFGSWTWDRLVEVAFSRQSAMARWRSPLKLTGFVPILKRAPVVLSWSVWLLLWLSCSPLGWLIAWIWSQQSIRNKRLQSELAANA